MRALAAIALIACSCGGPSSAEEGQWVFTLKGDGIDCVGSFALLPATAGLEGQLVMGPCSGTSVQSFTGKAKLPAGGFLEFDLDGIDGRLLLSPAEFVLPGHIKGPMSGLGVADVELDATRPGAAPGKTLPPPGT